MFDIVGVAALRVAVVLTVWLATRARRAGNAIVKWSGLVLSSLLALVFGVRNLSNADVEAAVAFLRAQPAAGEASPSAKLNVLGAILLGAGMAPVTAQPPVTQAVVAPPGGASTEYGRYLVSVLACRECHGQDLAGRLGGGLGPPGAPNLTEIVPQWSVEDFIGTLRTGVDPNGHELIEDMPWKEFSTFATDSDLVAMYSYLHGLPHLPGPAR